VKTNSDRWRALLSDLRDHWPNLSDQEIINTQGQYNELVKLIESKSSQPHQVIETIITDILEMTEEGNPNSFDKFVGIDRARRKSSSSSDSSTNEWEARENE
jgi:hypothetical protein